MPSLDHEALVQLFRNEPTLAARLLAAAFDADIPAGGAQVLDGNLAQVTPTEYRADLVIAVGNHARIVVEVQLRKDEAKRWSWPVYVAALRARERCPVHLLVVTTHAAVSDWARIPIDLGPPGFRLTPWVVGPGTFPRIEPNVSGVPPELHVLAALMEAGNRDLAEAALGAARGLDPERGLLYTDLVLRALRIAAPQVLEALMADFRYEYQSDFARKYYGQGLAEGRTEGERTGHARGMAQALLSVLQRRGLEATEDQRTRIAACTDLAVLERWIDRALDAQSIDDLFT